MWCNASRVLCRHGCTQGNNRHATMQITCNPIYKDNYDCLNMIGRELKACTTRERHVQCCFPMHLFSVAMAQAHLGAFTVSDGDDNSLFFCDREIFRDLNNHIYTYILMHITRLIFLCIYTVILMVELRM